jgi:lipopolysaccharide biosynthesis glycosyltransferase
MSIATGPIALVCAADDLFAMPLAVTVRSALENLRSDWRLTLFILDGGISARNRRRILRSLDPARVDVEWRRPSSSRVDRVSLLHNPSAYPPANFYRLLIPDLLPEHVRKVIYLDTDVVVKGDLADLWSIEIGDALALAAQDVVPGHLGNCERIDCRQHGVSPEQKYFNAGVMVINLQQWRAQGIADQVFRCLERHEFMFADQDALNIVLAGRWAEIEPRWNQVHPVHLVPSWRESHYDEHAFCAALRSPCIVHFTSRPKPWSYGCTHPNRDLFFEYLRQTDWAGWKLTPWTHWVSLERRALRKIARHTRGFLVRRWGRT